MRAHIPFLLSRVAVVLVLAAAEVARSEESQLDDDSSEYNRNYSGIIDAPVLLREEEGNDPRISLMKSDESHLLVSLEMDEESESPTLLSRRKPTSITNASSLPISGESLDDVQFIQEVPYPGSPNTQELAENESFSDAAAFGSDSILPTTTTMTGMDDGISTNSTTSLGNGQKPLNIVASDAASKEENDAAIHLNREANAAQSTFVGVSSNETAQNLPNVFSEQGEQREIRETTEKEIHENFKDSLPETFDLRVSEDADVERNTVDYVVELASEDLPLMSETLIMNEASTKMNASADDSESIPSYVTPLCGVWGAFVQSGQRQRRPIDMNVLYLLFENLELDELPRKEIAPAETEAHRITESAFRMAATETRIRHSQKSAEPQKNEQRQPSEGEPSRINSANSEFVNRLDDIDKFFEPDELDVGAVGLFIQEKLNSQGARIVLKRLRMGFALVQQTMRTARRNLEERFVDDEGNIILIDPVKLESVIRWIRKTSKNIYEEAHAFVDKLIERGIAGGLSRDDDEEEYESPSSSYSKNSENVTQMRELLRKHNRV